MAVINTNMKALFSQVALNSTERKLSIAMQQLSTGKRINSARDDAAGMAISTRMTQQIRGLNMAVRNAGDAISLIQTAEGATNEITDMMQRMRELAVQAVNDTNDNAQRSYLDLEFQQLKQQIVQIADNTEWNGFSLLNGKAGEQVGEMPMFKVTSQNQFNTGFINPTTTRTIEGPDAGENQTITLAAVDGIAFPVGQNITIGDVTYNISANETSATLLATKMKFLLLDSPSFGPNSGRIVTSEAGVITIKYAGTEGDVSSTNVVLPPAGLTGAVVETRKAVAKSEESFTGNGKYLQSGALSVRLTTAGEILATFVTNDKITISMTGTLNGTFDTVTFTSTVGANGGVISDNLALKFQDTSGTTLGLKTGDTYRDTTLKVAVAGTIPVMQSGDLWINGANAGGSYAIDDTVSPVTNAAGSAIAKAAAINRKAANTSANLGETQSITFTGQPIANTTIIVGGVPVLLTSNESTATQAATKIATTLRSSFEYGPSSGRVITYALGGATVSIGFPPSEGNVNKTVVQSGSSNLNGQLEVTQRFSAVSPGTGVYAKVNENIFSGKAQTGESAVTGTIKINGFTSANITSAINNPQQTRGDVVRAINMISTKTGVKAVDSGATNNGITLVAADGRNIEVRFETNSNAITFGDRIGMREGVQCSTISLESKIPAPVILTTTTGNIANAGLVDGNFTKNQSVYTTQVREPVDFAKPQVTKVSIDSGTIAVADRATITINGVQCIQTTDRATRQAIRDEMFTKVNAQTSITGVTATYGFSTDELLLTSVTPGITFTATGSSTSQNNKIVTTPFIENSKPSVKELGANDLLINGYQIRATTSADDEFSNTTTSSSSRAASAIATSKAINASSVETGVRAQANPAVSIGTLTDTQLPASGPQKLFINGIEISVNFTQNEAQSDRRLKVIAAINERTGQHGVTASDNGKGVTLSTDGRNLSVWFDSNVQDLKPSTFGLEKSGAVAQVSQIKTTGRANDTTAKVLINGTAVTVAAAASDILFAANLRTAIADTAALKNITATIDAVDTTIVRITSTILGSPFDVRGAELTASTGSITISEITANSIGKNDITGIRGASTTSTEARTAYGTVKLINITDSLPDLQSPADLLPAARKSNPKPFSVMTGLVGFSARSNFSALGFQLGNFGGRSSQNMDPPRVGRLAFQVGSSGKQTVTVDFADFGKGGELTGEITSDVDKVVEERRVRINTRDGATAVLNMLDTAMDRVNGTRATMGAVMNRLDHVINNLSNVSMNMSSSRSQVEDADYAQASTELAKSQIMQQAATAVLAQANTSQQSVLKLLQS